MRVLVCGGRHYEDAARVASELHKLGPSRIIEGGATGADYCAAHWAAKAGVPIDTFAADWREHGKAAGPVRNQRMLDEGKPDIVVAFPGGRGTADMVRRAKAAGVPVREIEPHRKSFDDIRERE